MTTDPGVHWFETGAHGRTRYYDVGEGPVLVLVHGSGPGASALGNWRLALPALGRDHRVLALDLFSFGRSTSAPGARLGIREWGRQVLSLLDGLGLPSAWLVGNSLGGWIALQLALDHPDRVDGIVSMGTGGAPRASTVGREAVAGGRPVRDVLRRFVWDPSFVTDEIVEERSASLRDADGMRRFTEAVRARDRDRTELPLDMEALGRLDRPVLLVHGREDAVIPVSRSRLLARTLPRADLHVFARCGHWSQIEMAEQFHAVVRAFLRAHHDDGATTRGEAR